MPDIKQYCTTQLSCTLKDKVITMDLTQHMDGIQHHVAQWVVDTQNKEVRAKLIQLGWTPPLVHEHIEIIDNNGNLHRKDC